MVHGSRLRSLLVRLPFRTAPLFCVALLTLFVALTPLSAEVAGSVDDLAWMTGTWEGDAMGGVIEERWSTPRAGSIAALVRSTGGGELRMIELIVIEQEGDSLVLRLQQWDSGFAPRSPEAQTMHLIELSERKVMFEAATEGGLKQLGYSRPADDQFVIHGQTATGVDFELPLKAVD